MCVLSASLLLPTWSTDAVVGAPAATLEYEANEEKPPFKHRRCWLTDETVGLPPPDFFSVSEKLTSTF